MNKKEQIKDILSLLVTHIKSGSNDYSYEWYAQKIDEIYSIDKYDSLIKQIHELYLGNIYEDEFKEFFRKWARKNNYPLPKMIKLLKDTANNSEGDIIPIANEDDCCIYYNDSCHRYCYLYKSEEGTVYEYIK